MEPDCCAAAARRKNFYGNERSEAVSPVCVNGVCELYVGTANSCTEQQQAVNPEFRCAAAPRSAPCGGSELGVPQAHGTPQHSFSLSTQRAAYAAEGISLPSALRSPCVFL